MRELAGGRLASRGRNLREREEKAARVPEEGRASYGIHIRQPRLNYLISSPIQPHTALLLSYLPWSWFASSRDGALVASS
jgi:hypothetical protein